MIIAGLRGPHRWAQQRAPGRNLTRAAAKDSALADIVKGGRALAGVCRDVIVDRITSVILSPPQVAIPKCRNTLLR